ncbi:MAG TPA: membrane protein insertion efficiency factor YidD [Candidatus Paceibacterota bacterium]|nr:membrane protein insertion efficiency factor YidD [Candidatus Paceibacterota bacterium]
MVSSLVVQVLTLAIRAYQITISPALTFLFGPTAGCRFTPTCSQYAVDAIRSRGAVAGSWLAAKRICRCHPFGGCGHDPIPKNKNRSGTGFQPVAETGQAGCLSH